MSKRLSAFALCTLFAASSAAASAPPPLAVYDKTPGGWITFVQRGEFCATTSPEGLSIVAAGQFGLVFPNEIYQMKIRDGDVVTVTIDAGRAWDAVAVVSPDFLPSFAVVMPPAEALVERLVSGNAITVTDGSARLSYSLAGSSAAIEQLADCLSVLYAVES